MDIAGYHTQRLIGQGAKGSVWESVAPDGSLVALKVFRGPYESVLRAARREAALAAQVDHPHVLAVSALVCDSDQVAIALPLAAGGSLADLLTIRGKLRPGEVLTLLIPIASALATAHERGVVHGDLSPANIVFDGAGRPLLTDLGAARVAVECGIEVAASPGYVAPEVARGGLPDAAADVFALGAVALHCLSGRPAWNADDLRDVVVQSTVGQWPDPDDHDGPAPLVAAVRSALLDVPGRRPGAAGWVVDLSRCGKPEPIELVTTPAPAQVQGPSAGSDVDDRSPAQGVARSMTRVRARGAEPVPSPPPRDGASRSRHARPGRRHRRPSIRMTVAAAAVVAVAVLAVQAGLMWAGAGQTKGSSAPQLASASAARQPVPGSATGPSARTTAPSARSAAPSAPSSAGLGAAAPAAAAAQSSAGQSVATPPWMVIATELDQARAAALTSHDPTLLDRVYTPAASARKADAATIAEMNQQRVRVDGAAHHIVAVQLLTDGAIVRLRVTDALPSYRILDSTGAVIGATGSRNQGSRVLELTKTPAGYRISAVKDL